MRNIKLLCKLILLRIFGPLAERFVLPASYTVAVTYRCNSRCKTCNIYKKKCDEMEPADYAKIFKSIGNSAYWVTMSGGEPFLRDDLAEIIDAIYQNSKPKIINIPTNGLLHEKIPQKVKKIAENCPQTDIVINLSIDAIGVKDSEIRGVPDAYSKAIKTYQALKNLDLPNLNLGIHTVISKFNVDQFHYIATKLMELEPDSYVTEIAENRVELDTMDSDITPTVMNYAQAIDFLLFKIKQKKFSGMNKITQTFRVEYYKMVKKILRQERAQMRCYAGILSAQITPDGIVWPCCIKAVNVGDLKEHNYNFKKLWRKSPELREERKKIQAENCYCPMANASYTNMLMNDKILFKAASRFFKKHD